MRNGCKASNKENSPYWRPLQSLCQKHKGKEIKQHKELSNFMKEVTLDSSGVCYTIQTAKIRGAKDKNAVYWIVVKETTD